MYRRRISASWLSDDMARALAAMCPPLQTEDVLRAADKLSQHAGMRKVLVVDGLFRTDVDPVNLRNVIRSLRALHDVVLEPQELLADSDPGKAAD